MRKWRLEVIIVNMSYLFRSANKCLAKVAHMSAQLQHFQKAAQLFEEVRRIINLYIVLYLSLLHVQRLAKDVLIMVY